MRRSRAVKNKRKSNERCSSKGYDSSPIDVISEFLDAQGYSSGEAIQEFFKEVNAFIATGRGQAISSKDATDARDALAGETAKDESASPVCRNSEPESCLSQILRVSSAGAAGQRQKKVERCLDNNKTLLNPELTLVHTGDGGNRLVELVRLLARRAARKYYEERKEDH